MSEEYKLRSVTSETWMTTCNTCGKPFRSDVKEKAIKKVKDHIRDSHRKK